MHETGRRFPSTKKPVLLVGGKGGVGKTTCSAAIATHLAAHGKRTLIITSDQSPSLSDIFEQRIGNAITTVSDHLDACELSQESVLDWWKKRFGRDFIDIIDHLIDVEELDKESQHQLLDYIGSAPSLREETMLDIIRDMAGNRGYDRIVWDTAPAGETLNLLDMPSNIRKHIRAGARVFQGLDRIGKQLIGKRSISAVMDDWIGASEEISRFIRESTSFLIVANPEALVVNQVKRMLGVLAAYRIAVRGLIINCVIDCADSASLEAMRTMQAPYLGELKALVPRESVAVLPRSFTGIRGIGQLRDIGKQLAEGLGLE